MDTDAFDSILEHVDSFGSFQRLLLAFVLLPGFVPVGFHAYNQLFMAATPPHYCRVPAFQELRFNLTEDQAKNLSIPKLDIGAHSQCLMYNLPYENMSASVYSSFDSLYETVRGRATIGRGKQEVVSCMYGWTYDLTTYDSTVVTEWDLVCDRGFLPTLALVLLGSGGIIGTYVFGILQDTLGRKPSFFIYLGIQSVFGIGTGLATDFWTWLAMRIGVGFTVPALMATPFVLALELVDADKRSLCTILLNIAYSMCLMALAGVAYIFRGWRALAYATTIPFLSFFVYWWVMPESPRWLFAHGKLQDAEYILRQIADINGKQLPHDFSQLIKRKYKESKAQKSDLEMERGKASRRYGLTDLLKGKVLRRNTLIITFIWFTTMGVYVGLSYYAPVLGGDVYLNFFLAGLAEMPTYLFLYPCLDYWGRRWTLFTSLIIGGVACVCTVLAQNEAWLTLTLYCIGKFGISAAFVAIQQIAAEIYPTVVRGVGISFSNVVGMIGPALVPLVNYTGQDYLLLPLLFLGSLMVLGGMISLGLPETLGKSLPQTLEDAEQFQVDCSTASCCPRRRVAASKIRRRSLTSSAGGIPQFVGRVSLSSTSIEIEEVPATVTATPPVKLPRASATQKKGVTNEDAVEETSFLE